VIDAADQARCAVEHAIARFMVFSDQERLRLYRLHLQATLGVISPVAFALALDGGFAIDQVARRLTVPKGWPWAGGVPSQSKGASARWMSLGRLAVRSSVVGADLRLSARLRRDGVLMRDSHHPAGELGYVVFGDELEAIARLGDCMLHTRRGVCRLLLPASLPDTITTSLIGRPIGDMVEHPVLADRRYRILLIQDQRGGGSSVVTFATPMLPLELPWAADLAEAIARDE
jgi:hypothetical protein